MASTRAYLRNGLPALYQDGDFGMRFVGALEELLDPIVAVLDGLPYHFDPDHAPPDILNLIAAWLGVDLDETQDIRHQREMVLRAAELGRRRGTVKGLELALQLHFPEVPMRVEDNGGVIWHGRPGPGPEAFLELRRVLRRPRRGTGAGGDRPLHRAVQAGSQHVSAAREGSEAEGRVMRTCQSCGKENPDDRDFCSCGEYLRWEPTGFVQAVTPEMAEAARQAAPPPRPSLRPRRPRRRLRPPEAGNGHQAPPPAPPPPTANSLPVIQRAQPPEPPAERPLARTLVRGAVPAPAGQRAGDDRPAAAGGRAGQGPGAAPVRRARAARARAGAGAQPERDRRQLRPAHRGTAARVVVDPPRHRLPGAVRLGRDVRAGGRDPPAPAALAGGRSADVGAAGRRGLQGQSRGGRAGAAGAAHPALRRDGHDAAPAAPQGPPQGDLRRDRDQQGQRARAGRARRRGSGRRAALRLQSPAGRDPGGRVGGLADAGSPAQADLDRARAGAPARGQDDHR